jgi:hypothetical protein
MKKNPTKIEVFHEYHIDAIMSNTMGKLRHISSVNHTCILVRYTLIPFELPHIQLKHFAIKDWDESKQLTRLFYQSLKVTSIRRKTFDYLGSYVWPKGISVVIMQVN